MERQHTFYVEKGSILYRALVYKILQDKLKLEDLHDTLTIIKLDNTKITRRDDAVWIDAFSNPQKLEEEPITYWIYPDGSKGEKYRFTFELITKESPKDKIIDLSSYYKEIIFQIPSPIKFEYRQLKSFFQNIHQSELRTVIPSDFVLKGWRSQEDITIKNNRHLIAVLPNGNGYQLVRYYFTQGQKCDYQIQHQFSQVESKKFPIINQYDGNQGWFHLIQGIRILNRTKLIEFENKKTISDKKYSSEHLKTAQGCFFNVIFERNNGTLDHKKPHSPSKGISYEYNKTHLVSLLELSQILISSCKVKYQEVMSSSKKWHSFEVVRSSQIQLDNISDASIENGFSNHIKSLTYKMTPRISFNQWHLSFMSKSYKSCLASFNSNDFAFYGMELSGKYWFDVKNYSINVPHDVTTGHDSHQLYPSGNLKKFVFGNKVSRGKIEIKGDFKTPGELTLWGVTHEGFKKMVKIYDLQKDVIHDFGKYMESR